MICEIEETLTQKAKNAISRSPESMDVPVVTINHNRCTTLSSTKTKRRHHQMVPLAPSTTRLRGEISGLPTSDLLSVPGCPLLVPTRSTQCQKLRSNSGSYTSNAMRVNPKKNVSLSTQFRPKDKPPRQHNQLGF